MTHKDAQPQLTAVRIATGEAVQWSHVVREVWNGDAQPGEYLLELSWPYDLVALSK
jgi:hypothetical protein